MLRDSGMGPATDLVEEPGSQPRFLFPSQLWFAAKRHCRCSHLITPHFLVRYWKYLGIEDRRRQPFGFRFGLSFLNHRKKHRVLTRSLTRHHAREVIMVNYGRVFNPHPAYRLPLYYCLEILLLTCRVACSGSR